ncbi:MAG: biotin/lipoyl-binding protein, partial [Chitinophagaceae bacterium]|nr:biotin/lipoyl-binding protein [Anaerolineae bacterium]
MRKLLIAAVILVVIIGGVLVVPTLIQQGQGTVNAQTTETAIVERTTLNSTIESNGTVAAEKTINLSFGTSGTVEAINVQVGDTVTAGQVLGTLDTADLEFQIALEEQSLAVQQSSYNQLIADPTAEEIAQAQASVTSAQSQLASAQNSLDTAPNQVIVNCSSVDSAQRAFESAQDDYDAYVNEGYEWDATFLPD